MVTLTNDGDLLQMFSLVQLHGCVQSRKHMRAFCLCVKLDVVTLLVMFHETGPKDKKQRTKGKERCARCLPRLGSWLAAMT